MQKRGKFICDLYVQIRIQAGGIVRTGDILLYLFQYGFFRIAFLIFGHRIDELTRCGTKVVHFG